MDYLLGFSDKLHRTKLIVAIFVIKLADTGL